MSRGSRAGRALGSHHCRWLSVRPVSHWCDAGREAPRVPGLQLRPVRPVFSTDVAHFRHGDSSIHDGNSVAEGFGSTVTITTRDATRPSSPRDASQKDASRRSSSIYDSNFIAEGFFTESFDPSRTIASSPRAPVKTRFDDPCQDGDPGSLRTHRPIKPVAVEANIVGSGLLGRSDNELTEMAGILFRAVQHQTRGGCLR